MGVSYDEHLALSSHEVLDLYIRARALFGFSFFAWNKHAYVDVIRHTHTHVGTYAIRTCLLPGSCMIMYRYVHAGHTT